MGNKEKDERIYRVTVKLSMAESEMVDRAAQLEGLTSAAYLRRLGLNQARQTIAAEAKGAPQY